MNNSIIYLCLVFFSFMLEQLYYPCKKSKVNFILMSLFHHFFSMYLFFGSLLFKNYRFHLSIVLITIILWYIYNDRCFYLVIYNNKCGFKENRKFYDIINILNDITFKIKNFYYYVTYIVVFYDILNIYKFLAL